MKKHVPVFFVLSFVLVSLYMMESCSKSQTPPNPACIESITTPATIGSSVTFVSCTSGVGSYTWNFGDGTSATGDSVLHSYSTVGTFRGSLSVVINGQTSTTGFSITIVPTGWQFNGGDFSIDSAVASRTTATLTATGSTGTGTGHLIVKFFPFPIVTGSYQYLIINATRGNSAQNQLLVILNTDSAGIQAQYGSTGSDSLYAVVGVSGGKLSISLPSIEMYNLNNFSDSTRLSATFTQTR
jgi:hypothetical protein